MSYTRRAELSCTEAEFSTYAAKVLLKNEILAVIKASGRRDIYYGDGVTPLSGLTPSVSYDELNSLKTGAAQSAAAAAQSATDAAQSEINAKADADRAKDAVKLSVVNDLVSGGIDAPLSAEQGKTLKGLVDTNGTSISALANSTVKFSAEQALTTAQRYQARKNIGAAAAVDIKDAYELQEAVRQGRASQILSVGDFFTVGRGGTDWLFQVAAFDYDVPVLSEFTHSMRLLMYPCFGNVAFDGQEAIYYAANSLPAGTYWFLNNQDNKYYSFTLTQTVTTGGQIVFTDTNMTSVKTYPSQMSTTAIETVAVTVTTTQPTGTQLTPINDGNRVRYGSNNWMQSAIRQWLNSAAASGWWTAKNNYDRPQAAPVDGFLHGIDADFLACIGKVRLRTGLNPADNAGTFGYSDNEELIFLPSRSEMGLGNSADGIFETPVTAEGTAKTDVLPLFKNNADRIKYLSGVARLWWVRSPDPNATGANYACIVNTGGSLSSSSALNGYGAVPACVIY